MQAAERYGVTEYARVQDRGAEHHLFADVSDYITIERTRTVMSGLSLDVTIDLVCALHKDGKRGLQYFFPFYFQVGWWLRASEDYPCTPRELYEAAGGHIYVYPTPMAPGLTLANLVTIPPVAPFGDLSRLPLACGGDSAESFFNDIGYFYEQWLVNGLEIERAVEEHINTGREYTALCATVLALHDLLYAKGASLEALEMRDMATFQALVDSLQAVDFHSPSGPFRYLPGTGDPEPVFQIVLQFAVDQGEDAHLQNAVEFEVEINALLSFPNGHDADPVSNFLKPLVWRDGGIGLGLHNAHLGLFPDCSEVNGVLVGEYCVQCDPGTVFDTGSQSCIVCPFGSYQNESGRTSCELSPPGFFIGDVLRPSNISECPVGFSCPQQGTLTPIACYPGTFTSTTGMSTCTLCDRGQFQPEAGASGCGACGEVIVGSTTPDRGASSITDCQCVAGTYRPHDDSLGCVACPAGMTCPLGSDLRNLYSVNSSEDSDVTVHLYPHARVGYMTRTRDPLFAYQCLKAEVEMCPGGPPGRCGVNRAYDVIACGECDSESFENEAQQSCERCGYFSWLPALIVAFAAVMACALTAIVTNVSLHNTPGAAMTVSALVGITVTSSQVLGILDKMDVSWGALFNSIAGVFGILTLTSRFLKLGCILGNNPVVTYLFGQLIPPLCVPVTAVILRLQDYLLPTIAKVTLFRVSLAISLANTAGTIISALFITIVVRCVEPFICYRHSGTASWSLVSSPSVLCYQFAEPEYLTFVVFGVAVFLLLPLPFLVTCMYFCSKYAKMVLAADSNDFQLRATRFLFYRFKPVRYYFNMILLARHLILGLVPAIFPDQSRIQALAIALLLSSYTFTQTVLWPWRSFVLNVADALVSLILVAIVVCGSLGMNDRSGRSLLQTMDGILASFLFGALGLACVLGLQERLNRVTYNFFICHHKAEAAAQARYLKMVLQQLKAVSVFIDSDDLSDLDVLFDTIKTSVQQLIVYLTSATLSRPWCVGEVVTSMKAKIKILPVQTRTFPIMTFDVLEDTMRDVVECGGDELKEFNILTSEIKDAINKLLRMPVIVLKTEKDSSRFYELGQDILSGAVKGKLSHLFSRSNSNATLAGSGRGDNSVSASRRRPSLTPSAMSGNVVVSTLPDNDEAMAVGGILRVVIGERVFRSHNAIVSLLEDSPSAMQRIEEIASTALAMVIVLTSGTMRSQTQVRTILVASFLSGKGCNETCMIPVTTPGFDFPGQDYFRSILPQVQPDESLSYWNPTQAEDLLKCFFRLISIFLPTHGSQQVLETSCAAIMDRLDVQTKAALRSRKPSQVSGERSKRSLGVGSSLRAVRSVRSAGGSETSGESRRNIDVSDHGLCVDRNDAWTAGEVPSPRLEMLVETPRGVAPDAGDGVPIGLYLMDATSHALSAPETAPILPDKVACSDELSDWQIVHT